MVGIERTGLVSSALGWYERAGLVWSGLVDIEGDDWYRMRWYRMRWYRTRWYRTRWYRLLMISGAPVSSHTDMDGIECAGMVSAPPRYGRVPLSGQRRWARGARLPYEGGETQTTTYDIFSFPATLCFWVKN